MGRRKRFSAEFKRQALRRAAEPGMTDALLKLLAQGKRSIEEPESRPFRKAIKELRAGLAKPKA